MPGWRLAARRVPYLGAVVLAGCTADVTGVGEGSVHGLVIAGVSTVQLIEYSAPPFTEARRLTLNGGSSFVRPMLTAPAGGFYAVGTAASPALPLAPDQWSVIRYGSDWTVRATRSGAELVGGDTLITYFLRLTPDERFLVTEVFSAPGAATPVNDLLVLDAVTLELVDRRPMGARQLYTGFGPAGTSGTQILFLSAVSPGCIAAVWVDVETGVRADSVGIPCDYSFRGALNPQRLYLYPQVEELPQRLLLWDAGGAGVAAIDSVPPPVLLADPSRGRLVGLMGQTLMLIDAQTLGVQRVVPLAGLPGAPSVVMGVIDPSGALFATVERARRCRQGICPRDPGLMVIDLDRGEVLAELELDEAVSVVPQAP